MATSEAGIGCAAALEALEVAAVEPRGLERLAEGRSPGDAAVAAHLAGCADCAAEARRLRDIASLLRAGLAPVPSPDLRDRTIAYVRDVGRQRGEGRPFGARGGGRPLAALGGDGRPPAGRGARLVLVGLAMVAVVVVAVGASALVASGVVRSELAAERDRSAALARTADIALRILDDPAAVRIPMSGAGDATGVAVISPAAYVGTVVATALPEAPPGSEYVCYVVVDGERRLVGRMAESGSTYAWTGTVGAYGVDRPASITEYGVLLVPTGSGSVDGTPVIAGSPPAA